MILIPAEHSKMSEFTASKMSGKDIWEDIQNIAINYAENYQPSDRDIMHKNIMYFMIILDKNRKLKRYLSEQNIGQPLGMRQNYVPTDETSHKIYYSEILPEDHNLGKTTNLSLQFKCMEELVNTLPIYGIKVRRYGTASLQDIS